MKIALLAPANNIHTYRWVVSFCKKGHEVHLISLHEFSFNYPPSAHLHHLKFSAPIGYIANAPKLILLLRTIQPDILNIHYATGYGLLGSFVNNIPTLISAWGSDIYEFPRRSILHKEILKIILSRATAIASTSKAMAREINAYIPKHRRVLITPFGIDTTLFSPFPKRPDSKFITVGTIKTLSPVYGIDTLIQAFSQILTDRPHSNNLRLVIAGDGPQTGELINLVRKLGIGHAVKFAGKISHKNVPELLRTFDIFVALSNFESFGVAILEAMSCGLPVVVSDADGPKEIVTNSVNGFIVPKNKPNSAADAINFLIDHSDTRAFMGAEGRKMVKKRYCWDRSIKDMEVAYDHTISAFKKNRIKG